MIDCSLSLPASLERQHYIMHCPSVLHADSVSLLCDASNECRHAKTPEKKKKKGSSKALAKGGQAERVKRRAKNGVVGH